MGADSPFSFAAHSRSSASAARTSSPNGTVFRWLFGNGDCDCDCDCDCIGCDGCIGWWGFGDVVEVVDGAVTVAGRVVS